MFNNKNPKITRPSMTQMFVKPLNSLYESTSLCKSHIRDRRVTLNRKPVMHSTVQIDLIRQIQISQDRFCFISLRSREDFIRFCSRNCQWTFDSLQLTRIDMRRVGGIADICFTRSQVSYDILATKAVSDGTNFLA